MTSLERFHATVERREVDRPAFWLGLPEAKALPELYKEFGVGNFDSLKKEIDDDVYTVELPYHSPTSNAIYTALNFTKAGRSQSNEDRTLTSAGFFEDYEDPSRVDDFPWDDPADYISADECRAAFGKVPEGKAVLGVIWSAHFQDTCAAFGMENALMTMLTCPEMFRAVDERIVDFYLKANEIFYKTAGDKLNAVLIGNDLGAQNGLMISPAQVREFVIPGAKKLIAQAKSFGLKVIYHSCGAIFDIIPDLIAAGVDVIHPIQALAEGMNITRLRDAFAGKTSFCGGVDTQQLLVRGTSDEVAAEVKRLRGIFPTGLILSPSHEALQVDVPTRNVRAMIDAMK